MPGGSLPCLISMSLLSRDEILLHLETAYMHQLWGAVCVKTTKSVDVSKLPNQSDDDF